MARTSSSLRAAAVTVGETSGDRPYQLVIVESPSKCKTIANILQDHVKKEHLDYDFIVTSCMGHVRNLPKSRKQQKQQEQKLPILGVDIDNQYQPMYEILPGKEKLVRELQTLARNAQQVLLATDEDREGEAVAWHLTQVLSSNTTNTTNIPYQRVTFTEITPTAIVNAVRHPKRPSLDANLIEAQETRRVLDRLAGFTLSPVLWRKIAPGLSAGRVQSVGMALIVQRERERLLFRPAQYWDAAAIVGIIMEKKDGKNVQATLTSVNGTALAGGSDFDSQGNLKTTKLHMKEPDMENLLTALADGQSDPLLRDFNKSQWTVVSVQSKRRSQSPPMPFTTSTLQQESNKRLGMSVSQTMQCAQALYESGFISYMRTDSTQLSDDAHGATERVIGKDYTSDLVAPPRRTKSKNAQEAHEAIRPAIQPNGSFLRPPQMTGRSQKEQRLYELIFKRTVASRMSSQIVNQTSVDIEAVSPDGKTKAVFRVSGSVVIAPGYTLALGQTSTDTILPPFQEGQELHCHNVTAMSHSTTPPPRYTEASFVKELEALGVGRPSTYAGTVQLLRDRAYIGTPVRANDAGNARRQSGKQRSGAAISAQRAAGGEDFTGGGRGPLVPSLSAFVVCSLLENHCSNYVDPEFTANMEERLDQIARGEMNGEDNPRVKYLDEFYAGENGLAAKVERIDQEVSADEARRASLPALFLGNSTDGRGGEIGLFVGPWGPYVQKISNDTSGEKPTSAPLPPGMAADLSTITPETLNALLASREENGVLMGYHPDDERPILLKIGRFGAYVQWGEDGEEGTTTHSLPKHIGSLQNLDFDAAPNSGEPGLSLSNMIGLSLDEAVGYVNLPRTVCTYQDLPIVASIGPYGPYLKYNNSFVSLNKKDGDVLTVDAETAERLVTDGIINRKTKLGRGVLAELGEKNGAKLRVKDGRYGVYINWKRVNAKMPPEYFENPQDIPLEEAWSLIQEKVDNAGSTKESSKAARRDKEKNAVQLPPAPKRPKSAYLFFCAEQRPQVAAAAQSLGDISKELARLWKETKDRANYEAQAASEKQEYTAKKQAWLAECQTALYKAESADKNGASSAANAEEEKKAKRTLPKRPRSAYLYFCAEHRPVVSQTVKSLGEVSKELARLWSETKDRGPYEALATADQKRYQDELAAMKGNTKDVVNGVATVNGKKVSTPTRSKSSKKTKNHKTSTTAKGASKQPRAPSAYMLFCRAYRPSIVDENSGSPLPFGETTQRLAKLWRECDDETRAKFQQQALEEKGKLAASAGTSSESSS